MPSDWVAVDSGSAADATGRKHGGVVTAPDEPQLLAGMDAAVASRIVTELSDGSGDRVLGCLRTAEALLALGRSGESDLRWAESAAYNVREALDSVVRDRPAGEGGFSAALEAWERYRLAIQLPDADEKAARADLSTTMDSLAQDKDRQAFKTRKLLNWFLRQTGVAPLPGDDDPTRQYNDLREAASRILHQDASPREVEALFSATVAWFVRVFTPPSGLASKVEQLAQQPYTPERLHEFRGLALNGHHLRLFLERITDPAWLDALWQGGLIGLPQLGEPWPIAALTGATSRLPDERVAELLQTLLAEVTTLPKEDRRGCVFEIIRTALWLGPEGIPVALEVLRRYPADDWTQTIALRMTKELDFADPIHERVADAVIGNEDRNHRGRHTREMVNRLSEGLTSENVGNRLELLAVKLRRLAAEPSARYLAIDIAALPTEDGDEPTDPLLLVAQRFAAAIPVARALGVPGSALLQHSESIPTDIGDRLTCQVLAGAADIDRHTKIGHLVKRLASETATGDDQALIEDLTPFRDDEISRLRIAFGQPAALDPDQPNVPYGENWPRAWRWAMVLPPPVLTGWTDAIAAVSADHGSPDPSALTRRINQVTSVTGSSPISSEALASMSVTEAATAIATWRPRPDDPWGLSARELARTLETVVKANPEAWTRDPSHIVRTLREPVYVDHYLRGVTASATAVRSRAPLLIRAVTLVRDDPWEPTVLGSDTYDFEPDWSVVDTVSIELIDALADADADLADDLDLCWELATGLATTLPKDPGLHGRYLDVELAGDPLNDAINAAYGKGLQAVLALGGWEHRNLGAVSNRLDIILTRVLDTDGAVGLQLRSIIAGSRPFVEGIAPDWIADNHDVLFGDTLGRLTFDQTLKYARPTKPFYTRSGAQLLDAARRGAEHAAAWLLIAYLWGEPEYSFEFIVDGLAGNAEALGEVCREIARLSCGLPEDQAQVTERGITFWQRLLAEPPSRVPPFALRGLGYWATAPELDERRWLELTEATVARTGGSLDLASEVAERCRDAQPSPAGLRILLELVGHGDVWEQHHVESVGISALRAAAESGLSDPSFTLLQERLIQRGHHSAAELRPPDEADS
jgi:hypothetical protein